MTEFHGLDVQCCNVLHHHLIFLLEEYNVFALASSVTRNPLFKNCSPVMHCSKEVKHWELTYKLATELFTSLCSYTYFHIIYCTSYSWIPVTIYFTTKNPLLHCTWRSCTNDILHDQGSLAPELTFLTNVVKQNGYSSQQIERAIKQAKHSNKTVDILTSTAYLPYTQTTYGRLNWILSKYSIKNVAIPPRKISSYMPPTEDAPGLWIPGIYMNPCECVKVYIGESGRSIQVGIK